MAPNNPLPIHGNEKTMNLNHLILTNIQSSPYFKVNLYELKTYHEVIDEIYYKVSHLEPWEKGSRKTAGQTGMCGGVRGVGAGGIVSSAFCLLYKLFTLRLTHKQVMGLCNHTDSPYIRGVGFMYIRYTQNPADFWDWFEEYLQDEEEIDVKAGGGHSIKIGDMLRQWLTKLEWYATLFPRIPVPVQKSIEQKLKHYDLEHGPVAPVAPTPASVEPEMPAQRERGGGRGGDYGGEQHGRGNRDSPARHNSQLQADRSRRPTPPFNIAKEFEKESSSSSRRRTRSRSRERRTDRPRSRDRDTAKDRGGHRRSRDKKVKKDRRRSRSPRERKRDRRSHSRDSHSHRHKHKHRSRSRERGGGDKRETSFERDLRKERSRQKHRHRDDE